MMIGPLVVVMVAVSAPMAHAATYTYVNGLATNEHQLRYSGLRPSISGGLGNTQLFSPDGASAIVAMETYIPAPGYVQIAFATGGGDLNFSHIRATNVHQNCWWDWPWTGQNIGQLKITCSTKS